MGINNYRNRLSYIYFIIPCTSKVQFEKVISKPLFTTKAWLQLH